MVGVNHITTGANVTTDTRFKTAVYLSIQGGLPESDWLWTTFIYINKWNQWETGHDRLGGCSIVASLEFPDEGLWGRWWRVGREQTGKPCINDLLGNDQPIAHTNHSADECFLMIPQRLTVGWWWWSPVITQWDVPLTETQHKSVTVR